jgi:hypothetical protein
MGVGGQCHTLAALPPGNRAATPFRGVFLGLKAGLNGCGKFHPHRNSIPGPFST